MRVIIPAAGSGTRFASAGYKDPKPLIKVLGRPMLQHVVDLIRSASEDRPLAIVCSEVRDLVGSVVVGCDLLSIEYQQKMGAALSVLCANGHVADNEPVMIVNCDNLVTEAAFRGFYEVACTNAEQGYGTILTMRVDGGPWSYVALDGEHVCNVVEKVAISNLATCGFYAFPSWSVLREAICKAIVNNDRTNGEVYLAPVYNYLGAKSYEIPRDAFTSLGVPEDVRRYEQDNG